MYSEIKKCRLCGNTVLEPIIHLGNQYLTGVFPKTREHNITQGPVELVKCRDDDTDKFCGLVQLKQSYNPDEMYGSNYGYRSALNRSMVEHLHEKIRKVIKLIFLSAGDVILDIGSNDSTLLQAYPSSEATLIGIDPAGEKWRKYYPDQIQLISDYFSAGSVKNIIGNKKAKIVTSIAMFYDLEDPLGFSMQVSEVLSDDGIWVFEQSYMPTMLERTAYDTICHEHLEYYSLKQIKWMLDRAGLKIIDVEFNDINGGSFSVTAAKTNSSFSEKSDRINEILCHEEKIKLNTMKPYKEFKKRIYQHRDELCEFVRKANAEDRLLIGYGASTKGNVILQFCGFSEKEIPSIAEVNSDKYGCYTPGTNIPIISEEEAKGMKPDFFLVLPWHFRANITKREDQFLKNGGSLIFPLPKLELSSCS
jgi:hypothetical protein